jgi:hypothetical protein
MNEYDAFTCFDCEDTGIDSDPDYIGSETRYCPYCITGKHAEALKVHALKQLRGSTRRLDRMAQLLHVPVAQTPDYDSTRIARITNGELEVETPLTLTPIPEWLDAREDESGPTPDIAYEVTPDEAFTISTHRLTMALVLLRAGFTRLSGVLLRNLYVISTGRRRVYLSSREATLYGREDRKQDDSTTVIPEIVARDIAEVAYCQRFDAEIIREQQIATETGQPLKVTGDHWVGTTRQRSKGIRTGNVTLHTTGAVAEKAWLDATISQLRINYRELARDAMAKTGKSNVSEFAQLIAIQRQAAALRHRHNYRRFVEALGTDPAADDQHEAFNEAYAKAETWRRSHGYSFEAATRQLKQHTEKITDRWVGVEGLIAVR